MKYAALSLETSTLDLSGVPNDDEVTLTWTERGGPAVEPPNGAKGYGSKLPKRRVSVQLGGIIAYVWFEKGVVVVLSCVETSSLNDHKVPPRSISCAMELCRVRHVVE